MPQYKPALESENADSVYEYANRLRNSLDSLNFPLGELSENKRVLQGLISFWHRGIAEPADLFIPSTSSDAKKQLELMQSELEEILERQDSEFAPIAVENGKEIPTPNSSYILCRQVQKALQNYIDEIKKVHDL